MTAAPAIDLAYVRFTAPDLDRMAIFLQDFGLTPAARSDATLHMRARNGAPFVHATELGAAGFAGLGFELESIGALEALSRNTGVALGAIDEPGGGHCVRLTDPNGFRVDAVVRERHDPYGVISRAPVNDAHHRDRLNAVSRVPAGPAQVLRLGHCVLNVNDFRESERWYKDHFGLITSDEIELAPGAALGAFLRCDRGALPVDHHTLFLIGSGTAKFNHAAFEVADFDALMAGHHHLKERSWTQEWGVGRHILGSQVFDYWRDPWGHAVEHWTDGDLFDAASGSRIATVQDLIGTQWGPMAPPTMG